MTVTTRVLDDAAQGLSRFLLMQLLINGSFGVFVGVGLWILGMSYPLLWGGLSTFLRYIPFIGPWIAMFFPFALSLAIMPGSTKPALIVGLNVAFELIANLITEPCAQPDDQENGPARKISRPVWNAVKAKMIGLASRFERRCRKTRPASATMVPAAFTRKKIEGLP